MKQRDYVHGLESQVAELRRQNTDAQARLARQADLLRECLAALVCMRGEYKNEPLIEAVKDELAEQVKA